MAKQELKQSTKPRLAFDENNHKHIFFRNNKIVLSNQCLAITYDTTH